MVRKKVKLAFITKDSSRKASFIKRKKGLLKKLNELSTLCGIDACLLIYSPYESRPEVLPSPLEAKRILEKFRGMPAMDQSKKMVNQESFIMQQITKAKDQLKKLRMSKREREVTQVMFDSMMDLNDLDFLIDKNLKDIYKRIEILQKEAVGVVAQQASGKCVIFENQMGMDFMLGDQLLDEIMTLQEHMPYTGEGIEMPFMDNNQTGIWFDSP